MATKKYLYEEPRVPSQKDPPRVDHLFVWRWDAKDDNTYLKTRIGEVHAPKTIAVWKFLVSTLLDPSQIHLHAALRKMITDGDKDTAVQKMLESLKADPPSLTLLDFRPTIDDIALSDMSLRSQVFLCRKLSSAIEETQDNTTLDIHLRFLAFNALLHEMAHWLHFDPNGRHVSGPHLRYKDWHGDHVGDKNTDTDRDGEAGYFIEGELWGGIIEYVFPHVSVKGVVKGLYRMPDHNTLRKFKDVGLIIRHPGGTKDTNREQISLQAMTKRLTPGTIIEGFADDELLPLHAFRKDAKNVWSVDDPTPKDNVEDEGKRRSKRRKISNQAARSRLAMLDLNDVGILLATAEFSSDV